MRLSILIICLCISVKCRFICLLLLCWVVCHFLLILEAGGNSFSSRHRSFISNICITSVFSSFRSCTFTSFLISFYKSLVLIELNLSIFPFLVGNSVSEIFKSFCIIRSERYSMISLQCLSFTFHN